MVLHPHKKNSHDSLSFETLVSTIAAPRCSRNSALRSSRGRLGCDPGDGKAIRAQMEAPEAIEPLLRTNKPDVFDCPGCAWPRSYAGVDVPILRERRQGRHLGSDLKTGDAGVLRGAHCQGASRLERPCAGG